MLGLSFSFIIASIFGWITEDKIQLFYITQIAVLYFLLSVF